MSRMLIIVLLWCLLFVVCWPLALLVLLVFPFLWLLSIPFRILSVVIDAVIGTLRAILMLPARILTAGSPQGRWP